MTPKKQLRAAIYARYSSDNQSDTSLTDQERVCRQMAEREGAKVIHVYKDAAISGSNVERRPEYQSAIEADVDIIFAESSSRLWRNMSDQAPAMRKLFERGVHVVTRDIDTRHDMWKVISGFFGSMNEAYLDEMSKNIKRGQNGKWERALKEGFGKLGCVGGSPGYGFTPGYRGKNEERTQVTKSGRAEINPSEAKIVREIFDRFGKGESAQDICIDLNRRNVPSPSTNQRRKHRSATVVWHAQVLLGVQRYGTGVLNNDMYRGVYVTGRIIRQYRGGPKIHVETGQWKRAPWPEMRIVTDKQWDAVKKMQAMRATSATNTKRKSARKAGAGPGRSPVHWLTSILKCGNCGGNFVANGVDYYVCASSRTGGCRKDERHTGNPPPRFRRSVVNDNMFALVKSELLSKEAVKRQQERLREVLLKLEREQREEGKKVSLPSDIEAMDRRLVKLRQRRKDGDPDMTADDLDAVIARAEDQRAQAVSALQAAQTTKSERKLASVDDLPRLVAEYQQEVERAVRHFDDPKQVFRARETTRSLIEGGTIALHASADGKRLEGPVSLRGLGSHMLSGYKSKPALLMQFFAHN